MVARDPKTTTNVAIKYRLSSGAVDNMATAISKYGDNGIECRNSEDKEMMYFAKVLDVTDEISEVSLAALAAYYELRSFKKHVDMDLRWLEDISAWRVVDEKSTTQLVLDRSELPRSNGSGNETLLSRVRRDTLDMYSSLTMMTSLTVVSSTRAAAKSSGRGAEETPRVATPPHRIEARALFGCIAYNVWLNDSIINFALQAVAADHADLVIVDPALAGKPVSPLLPAMSTRVAVFPVNLDNEHWCVLCVVFDWERGHTVFAYDPLNQEVWQVKLRLVWDAWCGPVVASWLATKGSEVGSFSTTSMTFDTHCQWQWVTTPTQPDKHSCGVFIITMARMLIDGRQDFQALKSTTVEDAQLLRLHWLHTVLSRSVLSYTAGPSDSRSSDRSAFLKWAKAANKSSK